MKTFNRFSAVLLCIGLAILCAYQATSVKSAGRGTEVINISNALGTPIVPLLVTGSVNVPTPVPQFTQVPYPTAVPQFTQIPAATPNATVVANAANQQLALTPFPTQTTNSIITSNVTGNQAVTFSSSSTKNATVTFGDFTLPSSCRGLGMVVDVTTVTGSGIYTFALDNKDVVSGKYLQVGISANVSTVTTNMYRFYPGLTPVANVDFNAFVSTTYRIRATLISGTSQVFSIGGWTIP